MALVYSSIRAGGINIKEPHDPNAELDYSLLYKPEQYQLNKQYSRGDVVLPPVFSGFYLECIDSGIAGSVLPVFPTDLGEIVNDNTVTWKTREYNFYLDPAEGIQVDGLGGYLSSWVATDGVTIISEVSTDRATKVWIGAPIPAGVKKFSVTNSIETTSGRKDDRTLNIVVRDR